MRAFSAASQPFVAAVSLLMFLFSTAVFAQDASQAVITSRTPLIREAIDESRVTRLSGNTHPLARPEYDLGTAPATLPMERMLLVLKRSPEQESALARLLDDQQDKNSPSYHKWLSPEEFGQQFGPTDADMQAIKLWLQSHGFQVGSTKGRAILEFSGSASQVQEAFHTTMHKYLVNGEQHWANSSDPSIPAALAPAVAGVFTLHGFYKKPQLHLAEGQFTANAVQSHHPMFTASNGLHALGPADYYTIYNINGQASDLPKIAIVGRSNINTQDVVYFHYWMYDQAMMPSVIVNGTDPGDLGGGEELEAVLDTTWAGVVAPSMWVALVVSQSTATTDGVDLSEEYIIENNLADVMSESFGDCEANFTNAEAVGIASLAQQAAAQGITYVVAAGDSGSAGCDNPNVEKTATHGLGVNILASTPYTVAVGGTVFNENGHDSTYWRTTNTVATQESAISYIPEDVWNDSCISCSKPNIWAGGGGASSLFAKPSWQSGVVGVPADGKRDLPDVSLTAAVHDPYLICLRGSCVPNAQGQISFYGVGGTSASTPAFAGIMGLVANKTLTRLGQPNYVLYRLAASENLSQCNGSSANLPASTCIFNDVTVGNNAVPGEAGYGTSTATYQSSKGYDRATGLGSLNVANLISQWDTVTFSPTTTTFSISPTTAVHGSPLNVAGTVAPNSGSEIPTGIVWLLENGHGNGNLVGDSTTDTYGLDSQGSYSGVTHLLPGGSYTVGAYYAGNGTFGGSQSSPAVQVTIQPEATTTSFSVLGKDTSGNFVPFAGGPYGTPVYLQTHIAWASGYGKPSSYVIFYDNNNGVAQAWPDASGNGSAPPLTHLSAGNHSITAAYYGDNSFNSSSNLTPINFTIAQIATTTALASQQTSQSFLLGATVSATGTGSPATGAVTFTSGGTILGTAPLINGTTANGTTQAIATFDATQITGGQYNVVASYAGNANYTASSSAALALNLVADFTIADRGFTSQTVSAGQTASYVNDLGVTPFFGFSGTVNVTCTVPAKGTTCAVDPASFPLTSGWGVGTISINTTSRIASTAEQSTPTYLAPWLSSVGACLIFGTLLVPFRNRSRLTGPCRLSVLLLLFMGLCSLGCGGGGSSPSGGGGGGGSGGSSNPNGTPAGSYAVTVTGISGSISHSVTFTLTVR